MEGGGPPLGRGRCPAAARGGPEAALYSQNDVAATHLLSLAALKTGPWEVKEKPLEFPCPAASAGRPRGWQDGTRASQPRTPTARQQRRAICLVSPGNDRRGTQWAARSPSLCPKYVASAGRASRRGPRQARLFYTRRAALPGLAAGCGVINHAALTVHSVLLHAPGGAAGGAPHAVLGREGAPRGSPASDTASRAGALRRAARPPAPPARALPCR